MRKGNGWHNKEKGEDTERGQGQSRMDADRKEVTSKQKKYKRAE